MPPSTRPGSADLPRRLSSPLRRQPDPPAPTGPQTTSRHEPGAAHRDPATVAHRPSRRRAASGRVTVGLARPVAIGPASTVARYLVRHYICCMTMSEPTFFVLTALVGEPRHGYGIVGEVDQLSGGRVRLKIGSLYGILDRLVGDGLVELDREEAYQGRLRRYYRITNAGLEAVRAEAERQAANARAATRRLRSINLQLGEAS